MTTHEETTIHWGRVDDGRRYGVITPGRHRFTLTLRAGQWHVGFHALPGPRSFSYLEEAEEFVRRGLAELTLSLRAPYVQESPALENPSVTSLHRQHPCPSCGALIGETCFAPATGYPVSTGHAARKRIGLC